MRKHFLLGLVCLLGCSCLVGCSRSPEPPEDTSPGATQGGYDSSAFVSSEVCASCHEDQSQRWQASDHDLAMQEATAQTVLADFDNTSFESAPVVDAQGNESRRVTRFEKRGAEFFVEAEGPDGEMHEYQVRYTFGARPLQQYLVDFPGGRLQCLDIAWDVERGAWFDLNQANPVQAGDAYHWTGRFQSWNLQCASCHSTAFEKNYDAQTDTYASKWQEIDVGCQACHGPARQHVDLAQTWQAGRPPGSPSGFEFDLRRDNPEQILNTCAACHSRRTTLTENPPIGGDFDGHYQLSLLDPALYHADGQIRAEVFVHGSFLQSKMHQKGVSCVDCHDPHSLDLWSPGDQVCAQCHSPAPPLERFDSLQAKDYASPAHHFHPQDSEGARCVGCHMPATTYMVIDPRRDHSLRIPRPDLSLRLGTPNACNGCHADESPTWAAQKIEEWYGHQPAPHFSSALGFNDLSSPADAEAFVKLPFDKEVPDIVRATAMERFPAGTPVAMQAAASLLLERDVNVHLRVAAIGALRGGQPEVPAALVPQLLTDPNHRVRIAAAQALAGPAEAKLTPPQKADFDKAFAEFEASQRVNADEPYSHLNLGVLHERRGRRREALAAYRQSLALDELFLPGIFNLGNLLSSTGDHLGARKLFLDAIERLPEEGELHYSLGLLLAGMDDLQGSSDALMQAARLMPDRPRVHYNSALALAQIGKRTQAESAFIRAQVLAPADPDYIFALATFYLDSEQLPMAHDWASRLQRLMPDAPGPVQLLEEIQKQQKAGDE